MYLSWLVAFVLEIQEFSVLAAKAIANLFRRPRYIRDTMEQMDIIGVGSIPIILLTGFFTGGVLALQAAKSLRSFGAVGLTGQLVSVSLVRELGPVLSALMLAGRIGSGIASELGSMMVTDQINAMRALGTDPIKKLVTPRMMATVSLGPLLTVICDFFGLVGGWLVAMYELKLRSSLYWSVAFDGLDYNDLIGGLIKPLVFGFIVSLVGCHQGLRTYGGTQGVGKSTTRSVVIASILVIISDFFLNKLIIELTG
jgi:phospholipid/cholesterol/gamma-HCH transport system permease protein